MEIRFEAKAPAGKRLRSVKVNGAKAQPAKTYSIGGCEREGEPLEVICRLRGARDVEYVRPTVHQATEDFLRSSNVISAKREERSRAIDLPDSAFSQDALVASIGSLR